MPELPEVQTTVTGLNKTIVGLKISDAWSDYDSSYYKGSETIKDKIYFEKFKKQIIGRKIISVNRRAKNVLINLDSDLTILTHMKMTGHFLFDNYNKKDTFNNYIRFTITFSNSKKLYFSDLRKFAKITLVKTSSMHEGEHLKNLGSEPLDSHFTFNKFIERLELKPALKIKLALMDQSIIAGIGNIYADESLWLAGIHPETKVSKLLKNIVNNERKDKVFDKSNELEILYKSIRSLLKKGIRFGGDSMSDYRNVYGEKGEFQGKHNAYQKTGEKCSKKGCGGKIVRIVVGGRGTHLCDTHQKKLK
jgi:formamidopyrimidine-DNA glycosylase